MAPEPIWKWGGRHTFSAKCRKSFFLPCPSTILALQIQLVVLVSALVTVSTVRSAKKWGHVLPVPCWVSATDYEYAISRVPLPMHVENPLSTFTEISAVLMHTHTTSCKLWCADNLTCDNWLTVAKQHPFITYIFWEKNNSFSPSLLHSLLRYDSLQICAKAV